MDSTDLNGISMLEDEIIDTLQEAGNVHMLMMGDINARTGTLMDCMIDDTISSFSSGIPWLEEASIGDEFNLPRQSCDDENKVNNFADSLKL